MESYQEDIFCAIPNRFTNIVKNAEVPQLKVNQSDFQLNRDALVVVFAVDLFSQDFFPEPPNLPQIIKSQAPTTLLGLQKDFKFKRGINIANLECLC